MKKTLKNSQMAAMLQSLQPLLSQRNKFGYMAARNSRVLSNSLIEYEIFKRGLLEKYGEDDKDENGVELGTISINIKSPNFKAFCDEMAPYNEIEHEVELMTCKYEETIGVLSGEEILGIEWMLEE